MSDRDFVLDRRIRARIVLTERSGATSGRWYTAQAVDMFNPSVGDIGEPATAEGASEAYWLCVNALKLKFREVDYFDPKRHRHLEINHRRPRHPEAPKGPPFREGVNL